jgi:FKBP-type peptidyl-prolyl cis-trans isomerase
MIRRLTMLALAAVLCATAAAASETNLESEDSKVLYALGLAVSRQLQTFEFTETEVAVLQAGLSDALSGAEPKVDLQEYGPRIDAWLRGRMDGITARRREEGKAYVAKMAAESGAVTTDSGMVYFELQAGDGASPTVADKVKVHYTGSFPDGKVFDSSVDKGTPAEFSVNAVVPCFSEGLQRMKVGGKSKLVCPSDIAYGERGFAPMIPPGTALQFEVELLDVIAAEPAQSPAP